MTEFIFNFDTEDYINPHAADGILIVAEHLRKAGIKGCFQVVGRLVDALIQWGRTDIIEALKHHEINTHSLQHSLHPTISEYTDLADFEEAKKEFFKNELRSRDILFDTFGITDLACACPAGDNTSYVAQYGYAEMGIPFYVDDWKFDSVRNRPVFGCNIAGITHNLRLDQFLLNNNKEGIDAALEEGATTKDVYITNHHPQRAFISIFCDLLNFNKKNIPEAEWELSPLRPEEETKRFYENFFYLVDKVKSDPRFHITTYGGLAEKYCKDKRVLLPKDLPEIKKQLEDVFFPVTTPNSYCIADILLACRDFLLGKTEHPCGCVYGFLDDPYTIDHPVTVTADEVRDAAHRIGDGFLPASISVGAHTLGLRDWLSAALEVLCGADTVTLQPQTWQIDMDQFPRTRDQNLKGRWIFCETFEDNYLSHRSRLQSWTYRLPKDTPRMIFD